MRRSTNQPARQIRDSRSSCSPRPWLHKQGLFHNSNHAGGVRKRGGRATIRDLRLHGRRGQRCNCAASCTSMRHLRRFVGMTDLSESVCCHSPCTKPRGRIPSAQQKDASSSALPQHSTTARVWLTAYVQRREAEEFIDWQHCRRTRVANTASIERLQQVGNVLIDSSAIAHTRVERKQRRKENRHATTSFCSFP